MCGALLLAFMACSTLLSMQVAEAPTAPQVLSPEQQAELQRDLAELDRDAAALNQDLPEIQRDLDLLEQEANRAEPPATPLITTPNIDSPFGQIRVGLYGEDIVNITAWVAEYGLDWYLFNHFKKFNIANVTENLLEKHEKLLIYLDELTIKKNTKEIDAFFQKECFIDLNIKRTLTSQLLSKIIIYILGNECIAGTKQVLLPQKPGFFDDVVNRTWTAIEEMDNAQQRRNDNHEAQEPFTIKTSTIISTLIHYGCFSPSSWFLDGYSNFLGSTARFFGNRPKFFDSYSFQLFKRFFVLVYFSRQLNSKYQELWSTFIKTNAPELNHILSAYAIAKAQHNPKDIERIQNDLTNLVSRGHAYSFFWWVRFKNDSFIRTNTIIETMLALPLFYKAGKLAYDFYNTNL